VSSIAAIIPTFCEAQNIGAAVDAARAIADEVIVADGGSPDDTAEIARARGATVVSCDKGRGRQLHAGARLATSEVLLFLHADAMLGAEARAAMLTRLLDPGVVGGNFLLEFEGPSRFAPLFSFANDLRRRLFAVYYGDSAIFVRRTTYEALGGFKPFPIFEDHEFVRRLERRGRTVYIRDCKVRVSSRRYEHAPVAALLNWALLHTLYSIGSVHPDHLARLYTDFRAVPRSVSAGARRH
jgi:rSAM/selenodomain-associated transferase 2